MLCTTLPLDVQGGIKGGLDSAFRFVLRCPAPLDSGFRRNDGGYAQHPYAGIQRGRVDGDLQTNRSRCSADMWFCKGLHESESRRFNGLQVHADATLMYHSGNLRREL